jgi:hypothetical protein
MTTILVWVLMIAPYDSKTIFTFSPEVATIEDCQRMQRFVKESSGRGSQCIQISVPAVKTK